MKCWLTKEPDGCVHVCVSERNGEQERERGREGERERGREGGRDGERVRERERGGERETERERCLEVVLVSEERERPFLSLEANNFTR
jgi:hypothetical protein